jgi:hypothetical protein
MARDNSCSDELGAAVVNHPRRVACTTRDAAFEMFDGIPACRIPKTFRLAAVSDRTVLPDDISFPLP